MADINKYLKIVSFLFLYFLLTLSCIQPSYSQNNYPDKLHSLLDSIKSIYGDTCIIGVNSNLITELYNYDKYPEVHNYLKSYEGIHQKIEEFRNQFYKIISNDNAILLDPAKIFNQVQLQNLINIAGIYFGADSLTNICLSYFIVRNNIKDFYCKVMQITNFDQEFKKELTITGTDWYKSIKLKEVKGLSLNKN